MTHTLNSLQSLDAKDPLGHCKDRFELPEGVIYFDGNSLGALPKGVAARMQVAIQTEWGKGLIRSWNDADWYPAPLRVGAQIAKLIGARPHEVLVADSTSVNLFKVVAAALKMRPSRKVILCETDNFPTDAYICASVAELSGAQIIYADQLDIPNKIKEIGDQLALVQLTHTHYKSGRLYDMAAITQQTQAQGALMIWDLAHSAGVYPLEYKYLNGGPGAPAFVMVREDHIAQIDQPLKGWHGHAKPFDFTLDYQAHAGIDRLLVGTAPQLSLIAFEEALKAFEGVDFQQMRQKSKALTQCFMDLIEQELGTAGFTFVSPSDADERGSQVSLAHEHSYAIVQALIARGVIGDFRAPNILRFGFAPLYVSFQNVWDSVQHLKQIMQGKEWARPEFAARKAVT
jgi:kynureninase